VTSFKDATTADLVVAERIEWLWPLESDSEDGRIGRGMIHVIAGKPDVGKGMVSVRIGADLAKAGFNVLHSAIEDSPGLITKPR
jgi:KaiC/GvpD/RAD55 family RecA-like ATPase